MNDMERQPLNSPHVAASHISGKLVILGILAVAITGAAVSWYFRYNATHRAAKFWGPAAAALIRDAPEVTLLQKPFASVAALAGDPAAVQASIDKSAINISHAHGLVHLRNALLTGSQFHLAGRERTVAKCRQRYSTLVVGVPRSPKW